MACTSNLAAPHPCEAGRYCDPVSGICLSCNAICTDINTEEQCRQLCTGWTGVAPPPEPKPDIPNPHPVLNSWGIGVAVAVCLMVIVIILISLCLWRRTPKHKLSRDKSFQPQRESVSMVSAYQNAPDTSHMTASHNSNNYTRTPSKQSIQDPENPSIYHELAQVEPDHLSGYQHIPVERFPSDDPRPFPIDANSHRSHVTEDVGFSSNRICGVPMSSVITPTAAMTSMPVLLPPSVSRQPSTALPTTQDARLHLVSDDFFTSDLQTSGASEGATIKFNKAVDRLRSRRHEVRDAAVIHVTIFDTGVDLFVEKDTPFTDLKRVREQLSDIMGLQLKEVRLRLDPPPRR